MQMVSALVPTHWGADWDSLSIGFDAVGANGDGLSIGSDAADANMDGLSIGSDVVDANMDGVSIGSDAVGANGDGLGMASDAVGAAGGLDIGDGDSEADASLEALPDIEQVGPVAPALLKRSRTWEECIGVIKGKNAKRSIVRAAKRTFKKAQHFDVVAQAFSGTRLRVGDHIGELPAARHPNTWAHDAVVKQSLEMLGSTAAHHSRPSSHALQMMGATAHTGIFMQNVQIQTWLEDLRLQVDIDVSFGDATFLEIITRRII